MEDKRRSSSKVGAWLAIGIAVGVALGATVRDPGMWVGIGVLVALFITGGLKPRRRV